MKLATLQQNRRFLLVLPLIVLPFLCLLFHNLGGGIGPVPASGKNDLGLNTQLPTSTPDPARAFENKLKAYQLAESDSARKAQYQRQDPYRRDTVGAATAITSATRPTMSMSPKPSADNRAGRLLEQLAALRQSLHQLPQPVHKPLPLLAANESLANPEPDPQLDRLNTLLDKVIRIQHPQEQQPHVLPPAASTTERVGPADTMANTITANIPEDQTLTNGTTVALRITDSIRINGRSLAPGRLVYGTVTLNNDRLLIHINSLREATNLYTVDWQVYDLDGLPGIHIPSDLSRDIAKQSADQGIGSLNVLNADPSLGAQAAGAGIQAAKSFFSRKVRQTRVTVKAGYRVLLRNPHEPSHPIPPSRPEVAPTLQPPDWLVTGTALAKAHNGGVRLVLRDCRIQDSCLWFGVEWLNHSSIVYRPAYARWYIRSRRLVKRTAMQEQTLQPLLATALPVLGTDSLQHSWFAFQPFALANDKQLILEIGEEKGDRTLILTIHPNQLLNAKNDETIREEKTVFPDRADVH